MANPEHLKILKQGVDAWNMWRAVNPGIVPTLAGADLRGANLKKANLFEANLRNADFGGACLGGAMLAYAVLQNGNFIGGDLTETMLVEADLRTANLRGATLKFADLTGANLDGTQLFEADFDQALIGWTFFGRTNLAEVRHLDSVRHFGPSSIGLDTFFESKDKIPESFLRGAGVPEIFIKYSSSLVDKSFEFYSAFISYSSKDDVFAKRLYADLQTNDVRCWFAPEDFKIGDKIRIGIDDAIRVHDKLLLILSNNSVSSDWVEKEVESAFEKEREQKRLVLFPIRLDNAVMELKTGWPADIRRTRHIGDFTNWKNHDLYQKSFERLLRDLKSKE